LKKFEKFSPIIQRELRKLGFSEPTPIQSLAFDPILKGENILLIAPTGSGKTEAAVLPVFEAFLRLRSSELASSGIKILYITPLRALNRDILRRIAEIGKTLGIRVEVRHGDTSAAARRLQALKPPDMLITTPETLQAILPGKRMRNHLKTVRWVIVDEIHELICDKRGVQLALGLERLSLIAGAFQRIGLSATIGSPKNAGRFLAGKNRSFKIVNVGGIRKAEAQVESPNPRGEDFSKSEALAIPPQTVARLRRLIELSSLHHSTLVFTNTREHAEALASNLKLLYPDFPLDVHHGSLSRESRVEVEEKLKSGRLKLLVCTSSLELGIDIGTVDLVIQYHSPRQAVKLSQRIGRSGHRLGLTAKGRIIAAWADDILESAILLRRTLTGELESLPIPKGALDVLAHQLIGLTLDLGRISLKEAYKIFSKAEPYADLTVKDFEDVALQLDAEGKLRFYGGILRVKPPESHRYYYENLSMIPEFSFFLVLDYGGRKIGSLDQEFVARHGKPGSQFILKGSVWRILRVDEERRIVEVESVEPNPAAIPAWEGEVIPVSFEAALEVGRIRREIGEKISDGKDSSQPLKRYLLDEDSRLRVISTVKEHLEAGYPLPTDMLLLVEAYENYIIVHACFGDKTNRALSRLLAAMIAARHGVEAAVQSDPYRIALILPTPINPYLVAEELKGLKVDDAEAMLKAIIGETEIFGWRLWNNAKRFGVLSRDSEYKLKDAKLLLRTLKETPVYKETLRDVFLEDLDLENLKKIISWIHSRRLKVEVAPLKGEASPLALPILDKIAPHDLLRPTIDRDETLKILKSRIASKALRLLCVFKGDWETIRRVENMPEKPRCPRCGSTLIAAINPKDHESVKILKKKISGLRLNRDEKRVWLNLWKNASLVQNYGKKAVIAMAARGVGPTNALKILKHHHKSEDDFYMEILKAEREYLRTRMFWD
jgi:ATP-dependent Lhr-like helicase